MYQGETLKLDKLESGIVELRFEAIDDAVNKFSSKTVDELRRALDHLESDGVVTGLLLTSGKDSFFVGADVTEFGGAFSMSRDEIKAFLMLNNGNFNRLEDLPFPTVAAVNGFALGGGLELILACDYRVISTNAVVGFPETRLGIIPGWGGTVRTPRLIGLDNAAEWIASAGQNKPDKALKDGMVDAVVEPAHLRGEALALLGRCISGEIDNRHRRRQKQQPLALNPVELQMAAQTDRAVVMQKAGRHYPAPVAAVDAMVKAAALGRDEALEVEFDAFYPLTQSPQCRALVGLFISDQYLSRVAKKRAAGSVTPIQRAGILGAGVMGGGIAYQNAIKGIPVLMKDIGQDALDLGMAEAGKLLAGRVDKGRLSPLEAGTSLARITPSLHYAGIEHCQIVIEAVVENPKIKKSVLAEVEQRLSEHCVLTSNTSTISINDLATALQRPEQFCGMHFFNPVHRMPLVEIIRGDRTSSDTIAAVISHALALGKKPVVVNDCPGFLVNRVLFPYFAGFHQLVRDGADFHQIDSVMEAWGWPMGPAWLLDVVGLDVAMHAGAVMAAAYPDRMAEDGPTATRVLFDRKRLGQKSGRGFYLYDRDKRGKTVKLPDADVEQLLADVVKPTTDFSRDQIIARMMVPMAIELVRCLEEGIVDSPAEADMALVYGLGFPPFRGGIFRWLHELGLQAFCDMAADYADLGKLYQPTEQMLELADQDNNYF